MVLIYIVALETLADIHLSVPRQRLLPFRVVRGKIVLF